MVAGGESAVTRGLIVAIFGPLLLPLSLSHSSSGEDAVPVLMLMFLLLFGTYAGCACWKLTARWLRKQ
jgi:hypothetical protein